MKTIPDIIKEISRRLRKNMTPAEKILWEEIRAKKILWQKFWRQSPIYVLTEDSWLDRYVIPDFVCFEKKVIIELDWSIHDIKEIYELDREKEQLLQNLWFTIMRFSNTQITESLTNVLSKIKLQLSCSCKE